MSNEKNDTVEKVRAAVKDRATWFALLYKSFSSALPKDQAEKLARSAIYEFGRLKAKKDPENCSPKAWIEKHVSKGSFMVFDSDVEVTDTGAIQKMKYCALVEAWKDLGCTEQEVELFCDIAMEGDRGRADAHGVRMELEERIAKGNDFCKLVLFNK
jgi:hypothetical protein